MRVYLVMRSTLLAGVTVAHTQRPSRVLIVAAAGYGKSAALEADLPTLGLRRTAADLLAGGIPDAPWLGVDDLDDLAPHDQVEVVRQLALLPPETGIAIASRTPLDPTARTRLRGQVYERGPQDLALEQYPIARILAEEYAVLDPEAAGRVHALTAGWPALVHFAADVLAHQDHADLSHALTRPGSAAATRVTSNVLDGLPDAVRDVLDVLADLGAVTPGLCSRLWGDKGGQPAVEAMHQLRQMGVLVPVRRLGAGGRSPWCRLSPACWPESDRPPSTSTCCEPPLWPTRTRAWPFRPASPTRGPVTGRPWSVSSPSGARTCCGTGTPVVSQTCSAGRPTATWPPIVRRTHADALANLG